MYRTWFYTLLVIMPWSLIGTTLLLTPGSSCVGKSSICQAMTMLPTPWHVVCEDDIYLELMVSTLDQLFPAHMTTIRACIAPTNIYHAIQRNQVSFCDGVSPHNRVKALEALQSIRRFLNNPAQTPCRTSMIQHIKHSMLARVYEHGVQGHDLLLDHTMCNEQDIQQLEKSFNTVITIGFFCQPSTLFTRFIQRNANADKTADLRDKRFLKSVMHSYFNSFRPAQAHESVSFTLIKEEVDTLFIEALNYLTTQPTAESIPNGLFTRGEFTARELNAFKQEVYKRFDFAYKTAVAVTFAYPCDILLCTDNYSSQDLAQSVLYRITRLPSGNSGRK